MLIAALKFSESDAFVIPAQAGTQLWGAVVWIPACAGMTQWIELSFLKNLPFKGPGGAMCASRFFQNLKVRFKILFFFFKIRQSITINFPQ